MLGLEDYLIENIDMEDPILDVYVEFMYNYYEPKLKFTLKYYNRIIYVGIIELEYILNSKDYDENYLENKDIIRIDKYTNGDRSDAKKATYNFIDSVYRLTKDCM